MFHLDKQIYRRLKCKKAYDRQSDTKISLGLWTVVHVELVSTLRLLNMLVVMCTKKKISYNGN